MEEWRAFPGYEGRYEISNMGRARSMRRTDNIGRMWKGMVLKPFYVHNGYVLVSPCLAGKRRKVLIHVAVAQAFIGPCPAGKEVNHKNGIKDDNRAENLEYMTRSENNYHAVATGLRRTPVGEDAGRAVLTWEIVREIRRTVGIKSHAQCGREYGVNPSTIASARAGKSWREDHGA